MSTERSTSSKTEQCTYWVRDGGRTFVTDPNDEILNLSRLTAYARYGKEIYDAHAHHEIPLLKIDAPAFLDSLSPSEHGTLHASDSPLNEVDGFPLIRDDP